ncbi:hypothetical protein OIO90_006049 [Microbotryomycetes sp. JL221]|nr:hypothetical protein OIO90_006049 [Microbotryomycetes sp. JL221]
MPAPMIEPGIAVVTGASSGIGRACAISLAVAGWTVVTSGRRQDQLEETFNLAKRQKQDIKPMRAVAGDLTNSIDVDALFQVVEKEFGRLDLLFNNAGKSLPGVPMDELSVQDFESIVSINVTAPFLCSRHAFRIMRDQQPQGGRIINNGSISAYTPRPFSAPYTLTKHAIAGLTKSLALDGRAYRIACSEIDIGNAESSMASKDDPGKMQSWGQIVKEPVMAVDYVADALVYMASLPLEVNILNQTIMATNMPFVGRG